MTAPRPVIITPRQGPVVTLDDLTDLVSEAHGKGVPGNTPLRAVGYIELNLAHGPRATRLTLDPSEAPA